MIYKGTPTKDGRCYYYSVSFKENGKYKKYNSKKYDTKREAVRAEADYLAGITEKKTKITIAQAVDEYLLEKKTTIKPTSYITLERQSRSIKEQLGNIKIDQLTANDYAKYRDYLVSKGFSVSYCNQTLTYFKAILELCCSRHSIVCTIPKTFGKVKKSTPKEEMKFYTQDQFNLFIKEAENDSKIFYALFLFMFYTGCRIGECNGLQRKDFNGKSVHISKTLTTRYKDEKGNFLVTNPKTKQSDRVIPLTDKVINAINEIIMDDPESYIFGGKKPLQESSIKFKNELYSRRSNLPKIRLHDFRHSFVSNCLAHNIPIEVISRYIGHATITETYNVYAHIIKEKQNMIVDVLNKI